jgi:hypothetical protein
MKKFRLMIMVSAMMVFAAACNNSNRSANPATGEESTNKSQTTENVKYTCPMHTDVVSDKPGECPKCGMTLVRMDSIPISGADTVNM